MFFLKKKSIVVNFITDNPAAFNFSKPQSAIKFTPSWLKKVPQTIPISNHLVPAATIRTCPAFVELYRQGFILPMWSDLVIEVGPQGTDVYRWQYADNSGLSTHIPEQTGHKLDAKKYLHVKLHNPWIIKTDEDIKWHWNDVFWDNLKFDGRAMPGVISFKYQYAANINLVFNRYDSTILHQINFGQPLVQVIPIDNRPLELRYHLVSKEAFSKINESVVCRSFLNNYKKTKSFLIKNS